MRNSIFRCTRVSLEVDVAIFNLSDLCITGMIITTLHADTVQTLLIDSVYIER